MSPWLGTLGYLWASTAHGNGAISENQAASQPSGPNATDAASIPEQHDPKRMRLPKVDKVDKRCAIQRGTGTAQER